MGGGPGGGPMQFGKSKAKFQMEPNTGITFDDVAGVDEAKQDFMEVRHLATLQKRGRQCGLDSSSPGHATSSSSEVGLTLPIY